MQGSLALKGIEAMRVPLVCALLGFLHARVLLAAPVRAMACVPLPCVPLTLLCTSSRPAMPVCMEPPTAAADRIEGSYKTEARLSSSLQGRLWQRWLGPTD